MAIQGMSFNMVPGIALTLIGQYIATDAPATHGARSSAETAMAM